MTADQLLQFISQAIFVVVFVVVADRTRRRPLRANVDTALLFGTVSLLVAEGWAAEVFGLAPGGMLETVSSSLVMALPYLLLRLVDDFAVVPRPLMRLAELGLLLSVLSFFV